MKSKAGFGSPLLRAKPVTLSLETSNNARKSNRILESDNIVCRVASIHQLMSNSPIHCKLHAPSMSANKNILINYQYETSVKCESHTLLAKIVMTNFPGWNSLMTREIKSP